MNQGVLRTFKLLAAMGLGLAVPSAHTFQFLIPYAIVVMLLLAFLDIRPVGFRRQHAYLLVANWSVGLLAWAALIPFDKQLVRHWLPVPPLQDIVVNGETFAQVVMHALNNKQKASHNDKTHTDWRTVALMPLSDEQIMEFARGKDVDDPQLLLDDLQRRNAQDFARRPQDLIELCADWRNSKRIRTHFEQVVANVRSKLMPRVDRPELAALSVDKAIEGASRLALTMMVTRHFTIRHSAKADICGEDAALDPAAI